MAHERCRFGIPGWKVMSELPNTVNFDAACRTVRPEDLAASIPHGPDAGPYIDTMRRFVDAGFEHIALVPVGDDLDGLLRLWRDAIQPAVAS
jgi:hypothetical protein